MPRRTLLIVAAVAAVAVIVVAVIIVVAAQLTPQASNPAFTTAVDFVTAAEQGDDAKALALLDEAMRAYAAANCPGGSPSACVDSFTPPEWGEMISAVFRRAAPTASTTGTGTAWDVEVIANYEQDRGASGVCSLIHVEPGAADEWRVAGWAGFVHCGDPESRDMATNPDTPNRAP